MGASSVFKFKHFEVRQHKHVHKVGTDSMVLGALLTADQPQKILDIGTGTGVLTLMMAQRFVDASLFAVEISAVASQLAQENFSKSDFSNRITLIHNDLLAIQTDEKFDVILSNPPYYTSSMYSPDQNRTLARHELGLPLIELLRWSKSHLTVQGILVLIIPYDRVGELADNSQQIGLYISEKTLIFGKPNKPSKVLLTFKRNYSGKLLEKNFTIRDEYGNYTEEYKEATRAFHSVRL